MVSPAQLDPSGSILIGTFRVHFHDDAKLHKGDKVSHHGEDFSNSQVRLFQDRLSTMDTSLRRHAFTPPVEGSVNDRAES